MPKEKIPKQNSYSFVDWYYQQVTNIIHLDLCVSFLPMTEVLELNDLEGPF